MGLKDYGDIRLGTRRIIAAHRAGQQLYGDGVGDPVAPAAISAPVISGNPVEGQILTATPGVYSGYPAPSIARQWRRGTSNITGATGLTYTLTAADIGANITLRETATNAAGQVQRTSSAIGPIAAVPAALTIAEFARDKVLFDSGAARGVNSASIPLTGTAATVGAVVQGRLVTEAGAAVTSWATVGTVSAGGAWSGEISCPRNAAWLRPEVRLAAQPTTTATTSGRFGVGHVVAIWGQSEPNGILTANPVTGEALAAPDMVQIIGNEENTGLVRHVTAATPITSSVVALANTLTAARPGEKFAVVMHTVSGTGFEELLNDSVNGRSWTNAVALDATATGHGTDVGLATISWFAAERDLGPDYGEVLFKLLTGKSTSGVAITAPADIAGGYGGKVTHVDHLISDLYDYSKTRILPYGPHRFDPSEDMSNAVTAVDGNDGSQLGAIGANRLSYRTAMAAAAGAGIILPLGLEPMSYLNGVTGGTAGWQDVAHPSTASADGAPRYARYTALAILQGLGTPITVPVFDGCEWQSDGSFVEVWSSAGAITTTRRARGAAALGTGQTHWTDVLGFEINAVPARRAEIQSNGRVRIYPLGAAFVSTDVLTFGAGGGGGLLQVPEDYAANCWSNYPIVAGSPVASIEGIDVRPMPAASVLANTVPAGPWTITAVTASGATISAAPAEPAAPTATDITANSVTLG